MTGRGDRYLSLREARGVLIESMERVGRLMAKQPNGFQKLYMELEDLQQSIENYVRIYENRPLVDGDGSRLFGNVQVG